MTTNAVAKQEAPAALAIKQFFAGTDVAAKFRELLGNRSAQFLTSIMQIVNSDDKFLMVKPASIYNCAVVAATMDLPLNNNLGFAYIIPYKDEATFQLGYRAYVQLAQRSGQFKTISAAPIYEGQLISENPLTGYEFDFTRKKSDKVIGYAAYFKLLNGFEKTLYMTVEELMEHAQKYSQVFKKWGTGLWKDDFPGMATKTVLKMVLSKFAPLSVEMQRAVIVDQAVINDEYGADVRYIDNPSDQSNSQENGTEIKARQGSGAVGSVAKKGAGNNKGTVTDEIENAITPVYVATRDMQFGETHLILKGTPSVFKEDKYYFQSGPKVTDLCDFTYDEMMPYIGDCFELQKKENK